MNQAQVADALEEIGRLLQFRGDSPFKARAYRNAAATLRALEEPLEKVIAEDRLTSLPSIGEAIALKIRQLAAGEPVPVLERLRAEIPIGVLDLLAVPGLGPKRAKAAYDALGVASLDALEAAATSGKLAGIEGFGPQTVATVLESLARVRTAVSRYLAFDVRPAGQVLLAALTARSDVAQASLAGGLRRRNETVHDIDLVAASDDPAAVIAAFVAHPTVAAVEARGPTMATVRLAGGLPADLRVVPPASWPFALIHFTGSAGHNTRLRGIARRRGLRLNEYGLFPKGAKESLPCADEAAVYAALGLSFVPPELREDRGEVEDAAAGELPPLVDLPDLRGVVHCHTLWSDGRGSIPVMAAAAQRLGFEYLVVCDHSRSASYAGGLSIDDLARQRAEIDRVNAELDGFRVLAGTEVDVLADGALDYPDDVLARLDVVVASLHGRLRLPKEEQTARVCRALENPWLDILGHPRGRLLLRRDGASLDMERVLDTAAENGVVLEINADPHRLDLDWRWHRPARERGIRFSIDPDAHGPNTIAFLEEGVGMARKGGLTAADVVNTLPVDRFLSSLRRNRRGGPS